MSTSKSSFNILVIEDNEGDFLLIKEYLTEQILPDIVHAKSFKQASVILSNSNIQFDVILLDLTLPDKKGKELVTEIITIALDCPVIILTGNSNIDFSIQSIYQGISDYLLKDDLTAISLFKSISYCVQRKKKIHQLEESEKRYSDLFQLSPQPMWLYDIESLKFIQVNKAALDLYGYSENEFLSMTLMDIRPPEEIAALEKFIKENKSNQKVHTGRFRHCKKSKEIIEVETYCSPITINGKLFKTVIAIDVTEKLLLEKQLQEQKIYEQRKLMKAVVDAQEKERSEIGEELHDNVNQLLAASKLYLNHSMSQENKTHYILKAQEYIASAMDEIRKLSHALVGPKQNDEMGLCDSVEELVNNISSIKTININFNISYSENLIEAGLKLVIYRIIQEQLSNILKHAKATKVEIEIKKEEENLVVVINDNGNGFDTSAKRKGIGLKNIHNRAGIYNGEVQIFSSIGNGCKMVITFKMIANKNAA